MNVRFMFPEGMGYLKGSVPVQTHDINLNMSYVPPVGSEVWVGSLEAAREAVKAVRAFDRAGSQS